MSGPWRRTWSFRGREVPVPWVASWTSETGPVVRFDRLVDGPATFFVGTQGEEEPIFGKMDPARQRRAALQGLCQVCGKKLGRRKVLIEVGREILQGPYAGRVASMEPPTCVGCAADAVEFCPGVHRARPRLLQVRRLGYIKTLVREAPGETWEGYDPADPPVSYVSVVALDYEVIEARALRDLARRLPGRRPGA